MANIKDIQEDINSILLEHYKNTIGKNDYDATVDDLYDRNANIPMNSELIYSILSKLASRAISEMHDELKEIRHDNASDDSKESALNRMHNDSRKAKLKEETSALSSLCIYILDQNKGDNNARRGR